MFNLENYDMLFLPKCCYKHGGLIIYVHKKLEYTVPTDIKVPSSGSMCKIVTSKTKIKN